MSVLPHLDAIESRSSLLADPDGVRARVDDDGEITGTICHFDLDAGPLDDEDFVLLQRAARALGAHQNGIEAFPFFAMAVLLAEFRQAPQHYIDELAVLFLIVRIAYVFTYLGNRPTLRSILWSLGFAINIAIFFLPAIRNYLPA